MEQSDSEEDFLSLYSVYMRTLQRNAMEGAVEEVSDGAHSCLEVMVQMLEGRLMFSREPGHSYSRWRSLLHSIANINSTASWKFGLAPWVPQELGGHWEDKSPDGAKAAAEEHFDQIQRDILKAVPLLQRRARKWIYMAMNEWWIMWLNVGNTLSDD